MTVLYIYLLIYDKYTDKILMIIWDLESYCSITLDEVLSVVFVKLCYHFISRELLCSSGNQDDFPVALNSSPPHIYSTPIKQIVDRLHESA